MWCNSIAENFPNVTVTVGIDDCSVYRREDDPNKRIGSKLLGIYGRIAEWLGACLVSMRSWVQIPLRPFQQSYCRVFIMKVFISQPMRGKTKKQILSERKTVVDIIEKNGDTVVSSIFVKKGKYPSDKNKRIWYLARALKRMSKADAVYFMDGWEESDGCSIEYEIAKKYGLIILNEPPVYSKE